MCPFLSLFFHFSAFAEWKVLSKAYGNVDISDIAVKNNRIIAVGTDFNNFTPHIVFSNDNGKSWDSVQVKPSGYFFKSIEFKDNDTGYIGGYGSVSIFLRTIDGGLT